jgi:hypothetical protein
VCETLSSWLNASNTASRLSEAALKIPTVKRPPAASMSTLTICGTMPHKG